MAIYESSGQDPSYGVAFVDTTIGIFNLGQFVDDKNLSRLRTLTAHNPPAEVLYERGGLSAATVAFLTSSLPGVRREALRPGAEFWDSGKTLKFLAEGEYFSGGGVGQKVEWPEAVAAFLDPADSLGLTASSQGDLAVRALGAVVWYLQQGRQIIISQYCSHSMYGIKLRFSPPFYRKLYLLLRKRRLSTETIFQGQHWCIIFKAERKIFGH